jgi:hypothetical protein
VLRKTATLALLTVPFVADSLITALNAQRKTEDLLTISGRVELWTFDRNYRRQGAVVRIGVRRRVQDLRARDQSGVGHRPFRICRIYAGGGLVSLVAFLLIWAVLGWAVLKLYLSRPGKTGFAIVGLFCASLFLNAVGGELQAEPAGFCFWCVVAAAVYLPFENLSLASATIRSPLITTDFHRPQES